MWGINKVLCEPDDMFGICFIKISLYLKLAWKVIFTKLQVRIPN